MKINRFTFFGLLSLVSGSVARSGNRFSAKDEGDPIPQTSRVTAFVNTDEGLKVECWEIGGLTSQNQATRARGSKGIVGQTMLGNVEINLFRFEPSFTLFSFGANEVQSTAVDFRAQPNLFTVKDGLIYIEARPVSGGDVGAQEGGYDHHVFADINGDDWFYFEDTSTSSAVQCVKPVSDSHLSVSTISGSDTTLIHFGYHSTPPHKVLHEGRCNFAGLKPIQESSQHDRDSSSFRLRSQRQDLKV